MSFLPPCKLSYEESRDKSNSFRPNDGNCRKNLADELVEEESVPRIGHVKVFLRIKPVSHDSHSELSSALHIQDEHTLVALAPKESHAFKSMKHFSSTTNGYKFSKIFGPDTSQKEVFKGSVAPFVEDFVKGTDCLLFAYGPSSAGKTFTIQGNPKHPGLIPRTLDVLFNTLKNHIIKEIKYKPLRHHSIMTLSEEGLLAEKKLKESILRWNPRSVQESSRYIKSLLPDNTVSTLDSVLEESSGFGCIDSSSDISLRVLSESRVRDKDSVPLPDNQNGMKYTIWVSFAEVYNETVYDLLEYLPGKAPVSAKRHKLKLVNDQHGNTFISDLREVCVMSGDEAYQVMLFGKCNLQFASTKLNHKSSRSHCIFTIKLVQVANVENPQVARINMLTFCDLAGSERLEKSGNMGERLKETGNINTSLLVLGRCLKALRNNQNSDTKMMVPFRDSKLTRIFQNSLTGYGNVAMIVNINQSPLLFDETVNVLKYSAVAQQIILRPIELPKPQPKANKSRFSVYVGKHKKLELSNFLETSVEGLPSICLPSEDNRFYLQEIARLQDEIENMRKEWREKERKIRHELCDRFTEILREERETTSKLVADTEKDTEEYYLWEIQRMEKEFEERLRKRKKESDGSESQINAAELLNDNIHQLKTKVECLTRENDDLKCKLEKASSDNDELKSLNSNNKLTIESLQHSSEHKEELLKAVESKIDNEDNKLLIQAMNVQIEKLNSELNEKNLRIKEFEELLEEASVEYLEIEKQSGIYLEEIGKQKTTMAEMELKIAELVSNREVCDVLLAECSSKLEKKDYAIESLEKALKEAKRMTRVKVLEENCIIHAEESKIASENELETINELKERNAALEEAVYNSEIKIEELQNQIKIHAEESKIASENELETIHELKERNAALEEAVSNSVVKIEELQNQIKTDELISEKLESLKDTYNKLKLMNEIVKDENKKLKGDILKCNFDNELQILTSNLNKMAVKIEEPDKTDAFVQCDLIDEIHKNELNVLKQSLDEMKEKNGRKEYSDRELMQEKDIEIINLQKAFKSLLHEKSDVDENIKIMASEKSVLEDRLVSLENELRESNKTLRDVVKEKRQYEEIHSKLKAYEESERVLQVLKEELEMKRRTIERLQDDNHALRDTIDVKEKELNSFTQNHAKQFKHYETLLNKTKEEIDVHQREEMRLRTLLQIGTPNKYEKSCQVLGNELLQLKRQLASDLCRDCSAKISLSDKKNSSLSDVRVFESNENLAPSERSLRRRSKSHPSYSFTNYNEYDDDSDFEMDRKGSRRRNKKAGSEKAFTGIAINLDESERNQSVTFEAKTPFSKSSRKLFNPLEENMSLDLKEGLPAIQRTPRDVIKRILRPRKK